MNEKKIFEEIWLDYHPKLQVYTKQLAPHIDDIENRVSEILLKVFHSYNNYNSKYALSTWIYRIARNTLIDELRKKKPRLYSIDEYEFKDQTILEEELIKKEETEHLKYAITLLEPMERELIFLYYYEDKNYREIAEITGIPEGTHKYRMSVTRKRLKSIMEKELI